VCKHCSKSFCDDLNTLRTHLQNEHPNLGRTPPKKRKRVSVDATEPKAVWTEHDNEKSNALLAQMLCECAVPFNTVSHPAFLEWVGHLNPSYGPANRTALSDIYLEQLYIKTKTEVDKRLKDTSVVFCVDQSKDGAGDFIQDDILYVAYSLDPRFRKQPLSTSMFRSTRKIIEKIHGDTSITNGFTKFRNKQFPFEEEMMDGDDPVKYWMHMSSCNESKALAAVALSLLGFPQSSASVERSFSAVRRIHTWQRALLGREKLSKLVFIYINQQALRNKK